MFVEHMNAEEYTKKKPNYFLFAKEEMRLDWVLSNQENLLIKWDWSTKGKLAVGS